MSRRDRWLRRLRRSDGSMAKLVAHLDGPHPPQQLTFSSHHRSAERVAADVAAVERTMEDRPYDLVVAGIGTEQELIERGVLDATRFGGRRDPRMCIGYLRYTRRDTPVRS